MRLSGWEVTNAKIAQLLQDRTALPDHGVHAASVDYAELLRLIMDRHDEVPFLESQIKYFHSLLLKHDADAAGHRRAYRREDLKDDSDAWGLGPAPDAAAVAAEMPSLVGWAREALDGEEEHPLLVIALFLFRFLVLRPFADGNGRLARALATYLLVRHGYDHLWQAPLEIAIEARRAECASALRQARADDAPGNATPWVEFFFAVVEDTLEKAVGASPPAPGPAPHMSPRQERLLELMRERGAAKIGDLLRVVEQPRATLKKDLRGLVDAGYLSTTGIRKGTIYRIGPRA